MTTADLGSSPAETVGIARQRVGQLGFWSAILTAVFALAAFAIGIVTPARSGVTYPYTDVVAFVPGDFWWMYPGLLAALGFVVLLTCFHRYVDSDRVVYSEVALAFAGLAAAAISVDYAIQLAVVQPSLLDGETAGLSLFSAYNPHEIFVALEDLGYALMSIAFLFAGVALGGRRRLERAVRWLYIVSSLGVIGALVGLSLLYGKDLEYRFEVSALAINWTVLVVSGVLLSVMFTRPGPGSNTVDTSMLAKRSDERQRSTSSLGGQEGGRHGTKTTLRAP